MVVVFDFSFLEITIISELIFNMIGVKELGLVIPISYRMYEYKYRRSDTEGRRDRRRLISPTEVQCRLKPIT